MQVIEVESVEKDALFGPATVTFYDHVNRRWRIKGDVIELTEERQRKGLLNGTEARGRLVAEWSEWVAVDGD